MDVPDSCSTEQFAAKQHPPSLDAPPRAATREHTARVLGIEYDPATDDVEAEMARVQEVHTERPADGFLRLRPSQVQELREVWARPENREREVGGYFIVDEAAAKVLSVQTLDADADEQFLFGQYYPYPWHTHPFDPAVPRAAHPPSGQDLVGTLAWGGVDNEEHNPNGSVHTRCDTAVTQFGRWQYRKTPALKRHYDTLPDKQAKKRAERAWQFYVDVAVTLVNNARWTTERFIERMATIDWRWVHALRERNPKYWAWLRDAIPWSIDEQELPPLDPTDTDDALLTGWTIQYKPFEQPIPPSPDVSQTRGDGTPLSHASA